MGEVINNYEILERLGNGGMGVVYKARHIHFNEIYAIKRLWEQFSDNEMVLNLFFNEAKILRKLDHPNIVSVVDVFTRNKQNYIVMEFIEGRTLQEIIQREVGPIQQDRAILLFKQILAGVGCMHNQSTPVIHRDIKPANILVTATDTVKIADFGIAKVLDSESRASTVVKGTPIYMSPEQIITPRVVDVRTDVYSLGMTFYEMLCGRTPFTNEAAESPVAIYSAIMNNDVPSPTFFYPGVSIALSDFVMQATHHNMSRRFADANEMLLRLNFIELCLAKKIMASYFWKDNDTRLVLLAFPKVDGKFSNASKNGSPSQVFEFDKKGHEISSYTGLPTGKNLDDICELLNLKNDMKIIE